MIEMPFINVHVATRDARKDVLRKGFVAALQGLIDEAQTAQSASIAPGAPGSLPTIAWLETSMDRLRELYASFEREEFARNILLRIAHAAEESDALRPAEGPAEG